MPREEKPQLIETPQGLALVRDGMELRCDFAEMIPRLRRDKLSRELMVRACRVKGLGKGASIDSGESSSGYTDGDENDDASDARPWAIDATAGLGQDALLLAAAGFRVTLFEKDPILAALLHDGLARASKNAELADCAARMHLEANDSIQALESIAANGGPAPDVVYLDPMFPERTKSAAVKKKFQLIHGLEAPCENEAELFAAACAARPRKVVVKRPAKGPYLAQIKPSSSIAGKAVRYDIYAPASMKAQVR